MLELIEIQAIARQGMTQPLICRADNNKLYYAKGKKATVSGLIKEWMAANLAKALKLPIPAFQIAYIDDTLVDNSDISASLGSGDVFVSEQVVSVTELKYPLIASIPNTLQQDILLFDLWIENADRTLTAQGGNPNILMSNETFIIDHNLAFDNSFNLKLFWETHVFQAQFSHFQIDIVAKQSFEARLQLALENWQQWWGEIPSTWKQDNMDLMLFNPDTALQRLKDEAKGALWRKLK